MVVCAIKANDDGMVNKNVHPFLGWGDMSAHMKIQLDRDILDTWQPKLRWEQVEDATIKCFPPLIKSMFNLRHVRDSVKVQGTKASFVSAVIMANLPWKKCRVHLLVTKVRGSYCHACLSLWQPFAPHLLTFVQLPISLSRAMSTLILSMSHERARVHRGLGSFQSFTSGRGSPSTSMSDRVSTSSNMKTRDGHSQGHSATLDDRQTSREIQD